MYFDDWAACARRACLCYLDLLMVKEGYYFGLPPLFFGGVTLALHWWTTAAILIALALFCFSFFRDPDRTVPPDTDVVVSPADSTNSGFLRPEPQERIGLPQSPPGVTRFRVTFTSPGTYSYICALHDELGMTGKVIVLP